VINTHANIVELNEFAQLISDKEASEQPLKQIQNTEELVARLDYHGITSLALDKNRLPAKIAQQLKPRTALMVANETLKRNALIELFDAFKQAGLSDNILFKGSALAYSVYPQPWLRPRSDSDLFIKNNERIAYEAVFSELGYQKIFAIQGKYVSYQNTFAKKLAGQSYINIDMHWRINNRQILARSYSVDQLLSNGIVLNKLSPSIKIPSAIDSLIIASLHRLGHHQDEERLTWLYDIHLLANALGPTDWATLVERVKNKALSAITLDALQYCEQLFGTVIDANAMTSLKTNAQDAEPSQIFLNRGLAEWRYFLHDLKALNSWRSRLRLLIENVLPSPAYIRSQMATRSATLGYIKRLSRGLRRIFSS